MNAGDEALEKGDVEGALREYGAAREMAGAMRRWRSGRRCR